MSQSVEHIESIGLSNVSNHAKFFWRIQSMLVSLFVLAVFGVAYYFFTLPEWVVIGVALTVCVSGLFDVFVLSGRRYRYLRYGFTDDRLEIHAGRVIHKKTCVPTGQILYMRTRDGPLLRARGLVHLQAGTLGEVFTIPYLPSISAGEHVQRYEERTNQ